MGKSQKEVFLMKTKTVQSQKGGCTVFCILNFFKNVDFDTKIRCSLSLRTKKGRCDCRYESTSR